MKEKNSNEPKVLTDFEKFLDLYAALFGKLTEGLDTWKTFVESSDIEALKKVLSEISAWQVKKGEEPKKPKLSQVAYFYNQMKKERRFDNPYCGASCGMCKGRGYLLGVYSRIKKKIINPRDYTGEYPYIQVIPCSCEHGNTLGAGIPSEVRRWYGSVGFGSDFTEMEIVDKLKMYQDLNKDRNVA
jgi:hypothetical protein